jgi:N-acetylmuramoyl-L-alanine amidase
VDKCIVCCVFAVRGTHTKNQAKRGENHSNEKDVALAIALKLGDLIEKNLKDVKVIFTRKSDVFVELEERAQIANRNNADLFISIHCNAASVYATYKDKNGKIRYKSYKDKKGRIRKVEVHNPKPYGSATYVMGISNEKGKLNTAKRENASMLLEDNYKKTYDGFDPESDEAYIVMSLWTGAFVEQSASLASKIQDEYTAKAGRIDKGVQRQSIWVLWRTAMPSILTEVGFLTNPEEEKFLNSEKGQTYMASSLFKATRKYKDEQEGQIKKYDDEVEKLEPLQNENLTKGNKNEDGDVVQDSAKISEAVIDEKYKTTLKAAEDSFKIKRYEAAGKLYAECNELRPEEKYPPARVEECKKRAADAKKTETAEEKQKRENEIKYNDLITSGDKLFGQNKWNAAIIQYQLASDIKHDEKYPRQKIKEAEEKKKQEVTTKDTTNVTPKNIIDGYKDNTPKTVKNGLAFKVQFAVSEGEPDFKVVKYSSIEEPSYYKMGSSYKITSGNFLTPDDAVNRQNKMRKSGYKDCFVVAFKNGQRMDYKEAVGEFSGSKR